MKIALRAPAEPSVRGSFPNKPVTSGSHGLTHFDLSPLGGWGGTG